MDDNDIAIMENGVADPLNQFTTVGDYDVQMMINDSEHISISRGTAVSLASESSTPTPTTTPSNAPTPPQKTSSPHTLVNGIAHTTVSTQHTLKLSGVREKKRKNYSDVESEDNYFNEKHTHDGTDIPSSKRQKTVSSGDDSVDSSLPPGATDDQGASQEAGSRRRRYFSHAEQVYPLLLAKMNVIENLLEGGMKALQQLVADLQSDVQNELHSLQRRVIESNHDISNKLMQLQRLQHPEVQPPSMLHHHPTSSPLQHFGVDVGLYSPADDGREDL